MSVKILAVGDVCGEPGLAFLNNRLKDYRIEQGVDFVVGLGDGTIALAQNLILQATGQGDDALLGLILGQEHFALMLRRLDGGMMGIRHELGGHGVGDEVLRDRV